MSQIPGGGESTSSPVHALRAIEADSTFLRELVAFLRVNDKPRELYGRFVNGTSKFDQIVRTGIFQALVKSYGDGLVVEPGVNFKHPETFEIGEGVFIGSGTYIQGRVDGVCRIGNRVWIGPGSYFDARALELCDFVGWGPGAKVLSAEHTGIPVDVPIITTELTCNEYGHKNSKAPSTGDQYPWCLTRSNGLF